MTMTAVHVDDDTATEIADAEACGAAARVKLAEVRQLEDRGRSVGERLRELGAANHLTEMVLQIIRG